MKKNLLFAAILLLNAWLLNAQTYPFTNGTRFNCRSEQGATNKFYVVINSEKTAKNSYSFVMEDRGMMLENGHPSLDGHIRGTWENGKVVLKKINRSNNVDDAVCFDWNGSFFKSFYGFYVEPEGAPKQSIQIKNLPNDYKVYIDGCQVSGQGNTKYVSLVKGIHEVEIYSPGFKNYKVTADTRNCKSDNYVIEYPAEKGKMANRISFNDVPPQSVLYIDGKKDKDAVLSSSPNTHMQMIYSLSSECIAGHHSYKIVSPGFKESSGTMEISDVYGTYHFPTEFFPDTIEKIQFFINWNNLPSDKYSLSINGTTIDNFADAFLNALQDNIVAVYDKDGTMIWIQNIYADKYNIELSEYAKYPHWLQRVRGVPENTDVWATCLWKEAAKFAKVGDYYYYPQIIPTQSEKWNIKAVNNLTSDVIFDANFIVEPDSLGALPDIVIDKSQVQDKWVIGDLFPGDDGKPIGIVIATTDNGEHGTILSLEEFDYQYVVSDGKRQYGSFYAASWAFTQGDDVKYAKMASYPKFADYVHKSYLSGRNVTNEELTAIIKKYFPVFYYADHYKVGSYTDWYLPNGDEMKKVLKMAEFLNQRIVAAQLTPLLDFENKGYLTLICQDLVGNNDYSEDAQRATRFMLDF